MPREKHRFTGGDWEMREEGAAESARFFIDMKSPRFLRQKEMELVFGEGVSACERRHNARLMAEAVRMFEVIDRLSCQGRAFTEEDVRDCQAIVMRVQGERK